jgi:hypothetical protein
MSCPARPIFTLSSLPADRNPLARPVPCKASAVFVLTGECRPIRDTGINCAFHNAVGISGLVSSRHADSKGSLPGAESVWDAEGSAVIDHTAANRYLRFVVRVDDHEVSVLNSCRINPVCRGIRANSYPVDFASPMMRFVKAGASRIGINAGHGCVCYLALTDTTQRIASVVSSK